MTMLLTRSNYRYLLRHPWQLALAILGIALGVAVVVAVDLANDSARRSFALSTEQLTGHATHQIIGTGRGVPDSFYVQLRLQQGIRNVAPVVTGYVAPVDNPALVLQVIGGDLFNDFAQQTPFNNNTETTLDLTRLLLETNTVISTEATAQRLGISPETTFAVLAGPDHSQLTLIGTLNDDNALWDNVLLTDIATAQHLLQHTGYLSHIDLALTTAAEIEAVRAQLPPQLQLVTAEQRNNGIQELTDSFYLNLTAMSLLALLVGLFLIYNSLNFAVVQRRRLLAQLRLLGVTQAEIFRLILLEAALLGVIGTAFGIIGGIWIGHFLVELVTRTITDLYYVLTVKTVVIDVGSLLKGVALGCIGPVLVAYIPAREAAMTPPQVALSRAALEQRHRRHWPFIWAILACGLAGAGLLLLPMGFTHSSAVFNLATAFTALFLWMLACALLTPLAVRGLIALVLGLGGQRWPLITRMALRDIPRHQSRTGVAIAALMIAIAATISIAMMVGSFRATVSVWLNDLLNADSYLAPVSLQTGDQSAVLTPAVLTALQQHPSVAAISTYRSLAVSVQQAPVQLIVAQLAARSQAGYRFLQAEAEVWSQFAAGSVLISEPLAYRQGYQVGDRLRLLTEAGERDFPIAGIYYDYGAQGGRILMAQAVYQRYWQDDRVRSAAIFFQPGADIATASAALQADLGHLQPVRVTNRADIRALSLAIFDRTFAITRVLYWLILGVAGIGLLSALLAVQLEQQRPFAILRALGLTTWETASLSIQRTAFMGGFAGLLAVPTGLLMGLVLIMVINRRAFGWTMQITVDVANLAQTVLLAVIVAMIAGAYPAWLLLRTLPAERLREE